LEHAPMSPAEIALPPMSELFERKALSQRHPKLLPDSRIEWALRWRDDNGLSACGGVYESPTGVLLIHEPRFIAWFLGLRGRSKPRAGRFGKRGAARRKTRQAVKL
jgi:hypothetical protein